MRNFWIFCIIFALPGNNTSELSRGGAGEGPERGYARGRRFAEVLSGGERRCSLMENRNNNQNQREQNQQNNQKENQNQKENRK